MEEGKRYGFKAKDDEYETKVRDLLKKLTGESKSDSNQYKAAWGGLKSANAAKYTLEMFCPVTGKRWEKKAADARAACPCHEKPGGKCGSVVALTSLR
jgi:hypothetical protein